MHTYPIRTPYARYKNSVRALLDALLLLAAFESPRTCTRWHVLVPATTASRYLLSSSCVRGLSASVSDILYRAAIVPIQPAYLAQGRVILLSSRTSDIRINYCTPNRCSLEET